jgi:hypothetical protein
MPLTTKATMDHIGDYLEMVMKPGVKVLSGGLRRRSFIFVKNIKKETKKNKIFPIKNGFFLKRNFFHFLITLITKRDKCNVAVVLK